MLINTLLFEKDTKAIVSQIKKEFPKYKVELYADEESGNKLKITVNLYFGDIIVAQTLNSIEPFIYGYIFDTKSIINDLKKQVKDYEETHKPEPKPKLKKDNQALKQRVKDGGVLF